MYPQPEEPDQYLHQPLPESPAPAPAPDTEAPAVSPASSDDVRARLMRRFEAWLDEALIDESAPEGVAQEILERLQADEDSASDSSDLYSLHAALTSLAEETRLQGRSFQQVKDGMDQLRNGINELQGSCSQLQAGLNPIKPLAESVDSLLQQDAQAQAQQQAQAHQSGKEETITTVLDVLIDIRARLTSVKDKAQAKVARPQSPERGRLLSKLLPAGRSSVPAADQSGLAQELDVALNRIDEALQQWQVRPIACMGQPFDAQTMQAVGITDTTEVPDNTVAEVVRMGYWRDDKVYRVSQVRLAKNQAGSSGA